MKRKKKRKAALPLKNKTQWEKGFLGRPWQIKAMPGWAAMLINGKPDGPRQFCKILFNWQIEPHGKASFNCKFDRKLEFKASRTGTGQVVIYDHPEKGQKIFTVNFQSPLEVDSTGVIPLS